jgi:AraC-like DNA-binding protein
MPGPDRGAWPRAIAEAILANYVSLARAWTGARVVPREVRFQHAAPRDTRELERFFGVRPSFGQRDNAIVFDDETLALPLATAEDGLLELLETVAGAQEARLGARAFTDDVRLAVDALLATDPSIERVARQLAISPRSLQRRLAADGLTFRDVVDETRLRRALELVRARTPAAEVAARLGFSDARAFRRAYQRWVSRRA